MPTEDPNKKKNIAPDPGEAGLERDMLELKLRAELGMMDSFSSGELPPDLEQQFLQQVYDFEKTFAEGMPPTFAESLSVPDFDPWPETDITWEAGEQLVESVLEWYRGQHLRVEFEYEYPPQVKYDFLTRILPAEPNFYKGKPAIMSLLVYEHYVQNHGQEIEDKTKRFMEVFFERNAEGMMDVLWRDQLSPESGPYDGQILIEYFEKFFGTLSGFVKHDYSILQISYDLYEGGDEEGDETAFSGMEPYALGYAEGMVGYFAASLLQPEPIKQVGPFKFYFQLRDGQWGIIYPQFPGLEIPPGE